MSKLLVVATVLCSVILTGCGNKEVEKARLALQHAKSLEAAKESEHKKSQTELAILQTKNVHDQTLMDKKHEQEIKLEKLRGQQDVARQERKLKERELRQAYYAQLSENAKPVLFCVVICVAAIFVFKFGFKSTEEITEKLGEIRLKLAEEQTKRHEASQARLLEEHRVSVDANFQSQKQKYLVLWENWDKLSAEEKRHCLPYVVGADMPKAIA